MPSLRELQCAFRDGVFSADATPAAVRARIRANGMTPAARLDVYGNNIFHNYIEALRDIHPVVERLVGEDFFRHAARQYIRCHPSTSNDLHRYGASFADFLDAFPPAARLPYLGDVARLEWRWHECFHAAEHPPLALEALAAVPPEAQPDIVFALHPAARLLASPWPVLRIWAANQPQAEADEGISLDEGGVRLLIRRSGFEIGIESLGRGEWEMLTAFQAGDTLAHACERACRAEPAFDAAACLTRRVADATLAGFDLAVTEM